MAEKLLCRPTINSWVSSRIARGGRASDEKIVLQPKLRRNDLKLQLSSRECLKKAEEQQLKAALHILDEPGRHINSQIYASLLRQCTLAKALPHGRHLHQHIIRNGYGSNVFLSNLLMQMYVACGSLDSALAVFDSISHPNAFSITIIITAYARNKRLHDARRLFDSTRQRDTVSWNAMITAYVQNGFSKGALHLYQSMKLEGVKPNKITFVCALDACARLADLHQGQQIHGEIVNAGFERDVLVGNSLVNMYGKCGSPDDALIAFDLIGRRDVISWNSIITAFVQNERSKEAIELFQRMELEHIKPSKITFICLLNACARHRDLEQGRRINASVVQDGYMTDMAVGNALINMYGKCGRPDDARTVFDMLPQRNVVSWNTMITAYAKNGCGNEAIELFQKMKDACVKPDMVSFICILDACSSLAALDQGRIIHSSIVEAGFETEMAVGTAIINMYGKCGCPADARKVFDKMLERDVIAWNALNTAYVQNKCGKEALELFQEMEKAAMKPDKISFICILEACAILGALDQGRKIHARISDSGLDTDVVVASALVTMYGKCGSLDDARNTFNNMPERNVVSWTAMVGAYSRNNHGKEALQLFEKMQLEGIKANEISFISVLDACASLAALEEGKKIHASIVEHGFETDVIVGNALVNMYGKCNNLDKARTVFDMMPQHNLVSWNTIIAAYAENGRYREALNLFVQMEVDGMKPDKITFTAVLDACASLAALAQGQTIHAIIVESGFETDIVVGCALVHMYGKCGSVNDARSVFDKMSEQDVASFTAMLAAYAQNGFAREALELLEEMSLKRLMPDQITFISTLSACSHSGMLDDGWKYLVCMSRDYGIMPTAQHYGCMIDLLGRAGLLDEADDLINSLALHLSVVSWTAFLGACRIHGDERGAYAAEHAIKIDPKNSVAYVLLSNIYAAAG